MPTHAANFFREKIKKCLVRFSELADEKNKTVESVVTSLLCLSKTGGPKTELIHNSQ